MAVLLSIVPKGHADPTTLLSRLELIEKKFTNFLGPRYSGKASILGNVESGEPILVEWAASESTGAIIEGPILFGCTSPSISNQIFNSIEIKSGVATLASKAIGAYMAIRVDRSNRRVFAWNTLPAMEGVHYSEDSDYVYISNRPLLIAIAKSGSGDSISLSEDYLVEYLNFGFSMSGQSPFESVRTTPSSQAISISNGKIALVASPVRQRISLREDPDPLRTGTNELVEALRSATKRAVSSLPFSEVQLRLSGGKDSRLMLGLLRETDLDSLICVTQGDPDSEEVMVAAELSHLAGTEIRTGRARLNERDSALASFDTSIREAQGFLLSEALGAPYAVADPITVGEGYAAGQWPTFKGPYERKKAPTLDDLNHEWNAHNAQILTPDLNELCRLHLAEWAAMTPVDSNTELLYAYGRDVRASRYMQATTVMIDGFSQVIYPFMDAEVTAVGEALNPYVRQSQIALFFSIREIWGESLSVPLARGGRFKFEKWGPSDKYSGNDYDLRTSLPTSRFVRDIRMNAFTPPKDQSLVDCPLTVTSRMLLESSNWGFFKEILGPGMILKVEQLSRFESEHDALMYLRTRKRRIQTRLFLWRLLLADRWLKKIWF